MPHVSGCGKVYSMTTIEEYGPLLRAAFATLHGGRPEEPSQPAQRRPGESLEEYLARSRQEALEELARKMQGISPPEELRGVHELLLRVLQCAVEADTALAAQVRAYGCGDFQQSVAHSERVHRLVAESARLDRELIMALEQLEKASPWSLTALGLAEVFPFGKAQNPETRT